LPTEPLLPIKPPTSSQPPAAPRRRVFLNTLFSILAKTQSAFFSYFTLRILLAAMSVQDYGYYTVLFQATLSNMSLLFQFGIPNVIVRFVPEFYTQARFRMIHRFFRTVNWLQIALWSILLGVVMAVAPWLSELLHFPGQPNDLRVFAVGAVAFLIQENYRVVLSSMFKHQLIFWVQLVYNALRLALIYYIAANHYSFYNILAAEAVLFLLSTIFFVVVYRRTIAPLVRQDAHGAESITWKRFIRYSGLQYINEIGNMLLISLDLFFVTGLLGAFAVGLYGLAYRIIMLVTGVMPQQVLKNLIEPLFFSEFAASEDKSIEVGYSMLSKLISFVTVPTAIWLSLMARPIIVHFFDPKFAEASLVLIILAFYLVTSNQKLPMGLVLQTAERNDLLILVKSLGLLKVLCTVLIVPLGGVVAMAWIALIASSLEIAFMYILMSRILKVRGDLLGIGRLLLNGMGAALVLLLTRQWLDSFTGTLISIGIVGLVFLALCYVNKPFSQRERDWLNRHLKYPVWIF
jgi:O-antigen/teichoic acid export membrane protein